MNKGLFQRILPHLIAVVVFLIVAVFYCKPVLQGEVLQQEDVEQWEAMAKNSFDYKEKHGHFPLWTNGMFSGMPAYQIAMEPEVIVSPSFFYGVFTLFLPKPISFFFLACVCFYFLALILRVNPYVSMFGALAYAYATYNPIIVSVGHDTKMWSIALMPGLIASIILIFERKYLWGAALTALFMALMIGMNHMQIVYYTLMIAVFMTIGYLVNWIRGKQYKHIIMAGAITLAAGIIGVLGNTVQIATAYEASQTTIRGGTELPDSNSATNKEGLDPGYALSYSMDIAEPFVMMVPNMYGASSDAIENKVEDSKTMEALQTMPQELANQIGNYRIAYWGGIGSTGSAGTAGPPYVGAIICFLTLIGFFILGNKHKWWILALTVFSIMISWGVHFNDFNLFLLDALPMYNKFRAPSMIIVIPTLLFCMMAVMTIQKILATEDRIALWQQYKKGLMLTAGVFIVLLLIYFSSDFKSALDKNLAMNIALAPENVKAPVQDFLNGLVEDRQSLFMGSLGRSFFYIAVSALLLWFAVRKNARSWWLFAIIGVLAFIDVMSIDVKYLNEENYQDEFTREANFTPSAADNKILADTGFFRVLDLRQGIQTAMTYGARPTAYFHHSIGGYHPAKLSIYQDLIERQIVKPQVENQLYMAPGSMPVINMLNTKYIIMPTQAGDSVLVNPANLGAAWFVNNIRYENGAAAVMNALTNFDPHQTAVLFQHDQQNMQAGNALNPADTIWLVNNDNDDVVYRYNATTSRFAVFSEIYYDKGWKAFVDGKELPIIRTNYVLRGVMLPAGQNKEIRFEFRPASYYTGVKLASVSGIIIYLLLLGAIFQTYRTRNAGKEGTKKHSA